MLNKIIRILILAWVFFVAGYFLGKDNGFKQGFERGCKMQFIYPER